MSFFNFIAGAKKLWVVGMIFVFLTFVIPQSTHAQYVDIVQSVKELGLDAIGKIATQQLVKQITAQTVNWINSGFKGNPAFVTDPNQFFLDAADKTASLALSDTKLNKLCSPFRAKVRLALVKNYLSNDQDYSCNLDNLKNNYDAFTQDFNNGGWDGWYEISQNSNNNPIGSYLRAQSGLYTRIGTENDKYSKQLEQGKGFLSVERCKPGSVLSAEQAAFLNDPSLPNPDFVGPEPEPQAPQTDFDRCIAREEGDGSECSGLAGDPSSNDLPSNPIGRSFLNLPGSQQYRAGDCKNNNTETVTPGSVVADQLNNALPSGLQGLVNAHEITDLISALLGQVLNKAMTSLRGLSQRSGTNGDSFANRLQNDPAPQVSNNAGRTTGGRTSCTSGPSTTDADGNTTAGEVTCTTSPLELTVSNCTSTPDGGTVCRDSTETLGGNSANECIATPTDAQLQETQNAVDFIIPLLEAIPKMNPVRTPAPADYQSAVQSAIDQANSRFPNVKFTYYPRENDVAGAYNYIVGPATLVVSNQVGIGDAWRNVMRVTCGSDSNGTGSNGGTGTGGICTATGGVGSPTITGTIDLSQAQFVNSPNVSSWTQTTTITSVNLNPGPSVEFSKKQGSDRWPDQQFIDSAPGQGTIYYTLWGFVKINGQWVGSGFERMYVGRVTGSSPYCFPTDWWYDSRWGSMFGHRVQSGEQVGFMVTAGDARNNGAGGTTIRERSNAVIIAVPAGSSTVSGGTSYPTPTTTSSTKTISLRLAGSGSVSDGVDSCSSPANSTCTKSYTNGASVTLTATAATGKAFLGWDGDCRIFGTSRTCTGLMSVDRSITASFTQDTPSGVTKNLNLRIFGPGSVTDTTDTCNSTITSTCNKNYTANVNVNLTATPSPNKTFVGWGGECAIFNPGNTCFGNMSVDRNVTATFR